MREGIRWQRRFRDAGVDGLLRDKTRKPGLPPLSSSVVDRVVELTVGDPPGRHAPGSRTRSGVRIVAAADDRCGARVK